MTTEHIPLPDGVGAKYAQTSELGLVLSDTPEQVAAQKAYDSHLEAVSIAVNLSHIAALTRFANPDSLPRPSSAILDTLPIEGRFIRTGNRMPIDHYRRLRRSSEQ